VCRAEQTARPDIWPARPYDGALAGAPSLAPSSPGRFKQIPLALGFLQQFDGNFSAALSVAEADLNILCMTGPVPGLISASVSHDGEIRSVKMEVAAHPSGGWHARLLNNPHWGLRCRTVPTAVMLEAAEIFVDEPMLLAAD
jgi:hypothetical protein